MEYKKRFLYALDRVVCMEAGRILSYECAVEKLVGCVMSLSEGAGICFVGNGGSAAIAIHMTSDFLKNGGVPTRGMHDPAVLTCLGNDYGYEHVFSKQLERTASSNDVLFAISSSGNSPNIVRAVETAKSIGMQVVCLSGFKEGNKIRSLGDISIYVPSMEYGIVESIHNMILQQVVDEILIRRNNGEDE